MSRQLKPTDWVVIGVIVVVLGASFWHQDNQPLGYVSTGAGALMLAYGGIAAAVEFGVRSGREPRDPPGAA